MNNQPLKLFIESCIKLDISLITDFFNKYPHLNYKPLKIDWIEDEPVAIKDRIIDIFNEHQQFNPTVTVSDGTCRTCKGEKSSTVFHVTYNDRPELNTYFGFILTNEEDELIEIRECPQYKAYQDLIRKRLFQGKTEEEIQQMIIDINNLPDL